MTTLFIDGHNFLFKSYAVPFQFKSKKGTQLQVVSTFLSLLRRAAKTVNADQVSIVFDSEAKTDNHELFEDYKANRNYDYSDVEMSPFDHLPLIQAALNVSGISWFEQPGVEADDAVATTAKMVLAESPANICYIASTDTDFLQLIDERCKILRLLPQGKYEIVDADSVYKKFFVYPQQYTQLKAWVGDKADNINGIDGIGWKRGAEIVNGTRTRDLSEEEQKLFERNIKLITLNTSLASGCPFCDLEKLNELNNNQIFELCDF